MKSCVKNIAKGKVHQAKGKIKEIFGAIINNRELELEGKLEILNGKIQEKIGDFGQGACNGPVGPVTKTV